MLSSAGATAAVLALGACTGGGHGSDSAAVTAAPVQRTSPEDYRRALNAAVKPLNSALTALEKATAYKALPRRMTTVEEAAAGVLDRLRRMTPPAAVATEHTALAGAVQQLDDELGTLSQNVDARTLCTSSAVRARLGPAYGTTAVRDAVKALAAKDPAYKIAIRLPSAGGESNRRLPNGTFLRSGGRGGRGTLSIDNGGPDDAVITLARGTRPVYSVYVRKGKKYEMTGMTDGIYRIFYSTGAGWDARTKSFSRGCQFERFEDTLKFRTTYTSTMVRWSKWTITLQPIAGGSARTSPVDPADFPAT